MEDLPNFLRVLKQRPSQCDTNTKPQQSYRNSEPEYHEPPPMNRRQKYQKPQQQPYYEEPSYQYSQDNSIDKHAVDDEVRDLKEIISQLQQKNKELIKENRSLKLSRDGIEIEAQMRKKDQKIQELEQIITIKENIIENLKQSNDQLISDYQRANDTNKITNKQLLITKSKIIELEEELAQYQVNKPYSPPRKNRYESDIPLQRENNMYDIEEYSTRQNNSFKPPKTLNDDPIRYSTRDNDDLYTRQSYIPKPSNVPPVEQDPLLIRKSQVPSQIHAALKDNIVFGKPSPPREINFSVEGLGNEEIRTLYDKLTREREEKERLLNKAPERAKITSYVRAEKEKLENEVDELSKKIAKVKYELKKRHAF